MKNTLNPIYKVSFGKDYSNLIEANHQLDFISRYYSIPIEELNINYYLPQPTYKKWVPNWLIKFITK
jgi:hypothetical protein